MHGTTRRLPATLLLALMAGSGLVACEDATEPNTEFDAIATAESLESLAAAGERMEEAWAGLALASGLFEGTAIAPVLSAKAGPLSGEAAAELASLEVAAAFFPSNYLGKTFVWDPIEERYVEGDEAAPFDDGIRVIYYAVDPISGQPADELVALGYLDLRDLSTPASDRLGIAVVNTAGDEPVTLADYYMDVSFTQTSGAASIVLASQGFLSNGSDQLDFELEQSIGLSEAGISVSQDYSMSLAGTDLSVAFQGTFSTSFETQAGTMEMIATITGDGSTVVFTLAGDETAIEGTIQHNGTVVANISGDPDAPDFTRADGEPFDQGDYQALRGLVDAVEDLLSLAEDIFSGFGDA